MNSIIEELINLQDNSTKVEVEIVSLEETQKETIHGVLVGRVISANETEPVLVDYSNNPFGPLPARSIVDIPLDDVNREVLLLFEKNNPQLPIIIGFIQNQPVILAKEITISKNKVREIIVDEERVVFEADKKIELRCGKSSLVMNSDGRVVIKGTQLNKPCQQNKQN